LRARANVALLRLLLDASADGRDRMRRQEGQAFVEYAMVLLLVAVALAAGAFVTPFRAALENAFGAIGGAISAALPNRAPLAVVTFVGGRWPWV
jgi:Flp pilus assembly pilin Flp